MSRLSENEMRSKIRYIKDEYNAGRNPLPHINGLHHLDRNLLEQRLSQYIRTLRRVQELRGEPLNQNYAGYKKTIRKKVKKMKKGKSLRKPTKGKPKRKHTRRN